MNINELHHQDKAVSVASLFKGETANVAAIKLLQGEKLKEHSTQTPALLICISGKAVFENEKGFSEVLTPGDYLNIEPITKHWVTGLEKSHLILIK